MASTIIIGTGAYLPERVVSNEEIAEKLGVQPAWILDETGVKERRYARDDETPADMSYAAAQIALADAGTTIEEIDYMVSAIEHSDTYFPGNGCFVQEKFQLGTGVGALDVRNQAAGFIYALSAADALIRAGIYKNVLLNGTELNSCALEWTSEGKDLTPSLADGSGAVVLGPGEDGTGVLATDLNADGRFARDYWVRSESNAHHPRLTLEMLEAGHQYPRINVEVFYEHAVEGLVASIKRTLESAGIATGDVSMFLLQQGNRRVNESVAAKLGLPAGSVDHSIERYGNTGAASIPIALDEGLRCNRIGRGATVVMAAFGAGFVWGSAVVKL